MDYLYYFYNASLTLRVIEYLHRKPELPLAFVSVIHQPSGWIVRIKFQHPLPSLEAGNFRAVLNELGGAYKGGSPVQMALKALEMGRSPTQVMQRHHVAVIAHGQPDRNEIENFQKQFIQGLGYCPETLA